MVNQQALEVYVKNFFNCEDKIAAAIIKSSEQNGERLANYYHYIVKK